MRVLVLVSLLAFVSICSGGAARADTGGLTLTEFRTHDGSGWYYATAPGEIEAATAQYDMTGRRSIATLQPRHVDGSVAVYRLRTTAHEGYLLTSSGAEVSALLNSGHFQYERILGYVATSPAAGTQELDRLSNGKTWRVATVTGRDALTADGYKVDGPLGFTG